VGCNTHVHGSNARNLPVQLSLSQTSKNALSFLLLLMSTLLENWRRQQKRFCLEARGKGGNGGWEWNMRNGPMYVHMNK
jgi:hypothetical protein